MKKLFWILATLLFTVSLQAQIYSFSASSDFTTDTLNYGMLHLEIGASAISSTLLRIDSAGDDVDIVFNEALSSGDATILHNDETGPSGGLIGAHTAIVPGSFVDAIFFPVPPDATAGDHLTCSVATDGAQRFNFNVPLSAIEVISLDLIGFPESGAAGTGKDIDLASDYGSLDQSRTTHSESDTAATYDTGTTDTLFKLDLLPVFSTLSGGDLGGVLVTHQTVGGTIHYLGIRMCYNR